MEESEKMVALKKAYAEIILNTAKEAANRVMASEKKAVRFQHHLSTTKNESLRLLVRLKQMIDAKTIEAEITSSNQQSRIDELEAQLQEAEGVIIDLRAELNWVHDKLEKVRNNQGQPLNGKATHENELPDQNPTLEPIILPPNSGLHTVTTAGLRNTILDERILVNKCCSATEQTEQFSAFHFENHSSHNTGLASIITRNKESELSRNGFAWDEGLCCASSPKTKTMEMEKNFSGEEMKKLVKIRTLRRRKTRFGKSKAKRRPCPSQLMKPYEPPSILSRCRTYSVNGNAKSDECLCTLPSIKTDNVDVKDYSRELEGKLHHKNSYFNDAKMIVHTEKRERQMQSGDAISPSLASHPNQCSRFCHPSSLLTRCIAYSFSLRGNVKSGEDQPKITENKVKLKPLPRLDPGLTLIKGGVDPVSGSKNFTVSVKALGTYGAVQNAANKDMDPVDKILNLDSDAAVGTTLPDHETNCEMINVPQVYSHSKDTKAFEETTANGAKASEETVVGVPLLYSDLEDAKMSMEPITSSSQTDNNRPLKYTFQRKRKKEALSSPEQNDSLEKSSMKRRAEEKQNDSSELQASSLINELSRDSRRLAQVARQLISLSGKRWW